MEPAQEEGGSSSTLDAWRRERERAHSDILVEVAALGGHGPAFAHAGYTDEQRGEQQSNAASADGNALDTEGTDEGDDPGDAAAWAPDSQVQPASSPAPDLPDSAAQTVPQDTGNIQTLPQLPAAAADADHTVVSQRSSQARTWCAKLGTAVAMQGVVQFLTGHVCMEEVALWRMQTASCAWNPGVWEDSVPDKAGRGLSSNDVQACSDSTSTQSHAVSRGALVMRSLVSFWSNSWHAATPDAATIEARRDWSRDLHDEAFEVVAANSFIWNRALRPIMGIGFAQLLHAHCPKQLWAKALLVAIPLLRHPLKVVSLRLVCPGWPPPSFWHLILYTLDNSSKTSMMAGILPKICSQLLVDALRRCRLHEKLCAMVLRTRPAPALSRGVRFAGGEGADWGEVRGVQQGDGAERGERAARRQREAQRAGERGVERRSAWGIYQPLQRVLAGMVEELMLATVAYPLVVLERRMCVDVSTPPCRLNTCSPLAQTERLLPLTTLTYTFNHSGQRSFERPLSPGKPPLRIPTCAA